MFGFYGKLPAHGDFIRFRADAGFVLAWDGWLQQCFAASREQLGAGWDEAYQNAPIWRFCFGAGLCGPDAIVGVMMPSQDRVGRMFPLTVFQKRGGTPDAAQLDAEPAMTQVEDAMLHALTRQTDKSVLADQLQAIDLPDAGGGAGGQSHWLSVFFGGEARRDVFAFDGLPSPEAYCDLLRPANVESADV